MWSLAVHSQRLAWVSGMYCHVFFLWHISQTHTQWFNMCGPGIQNCPFRYTNRFTMWHLAPSNSKDLGTKGLHSIPYSSCSCVLLDLWFCVCLWACSVFARKQWNAWAWHHLRPWLLWALDDLCGLSEASALIWSDKQKQLHCKHQASYCFDGLPRRFYFVQVIVM